MSDCFVLYLLLTCMKKKTSGADKFTNNRLTKEKILTKYSEEEYEEAEKAMLVET